MGPQLEPGRNCWRIEQAGRASVIIDACDYYHIVRQMMERAERRILIIGWDFDPRILIDRDDNGEPTGVLKESAMRLVTQHVPPPAPGRMGEAITAMADELNRECMTGAKDPGIGYSLGYDPDNALKTWTAYREVLAAGDRVDQTSDR